MKPRVYQKKKKQIPTFLVIWNNARKHYEKHQILSNYIKNHKYHAKLKKILQKKCKPQKTSKSNWNGLKSTKMYIFIMHPSQGPKSRGVAPGGATQGVHLYFSALLNHDQLILYRYCHEVTIIGFSVALLVSLL